MHFDVVYMTHSVNANNTKREWQFGIKIPYHTIYIYEIEVTHI